MIVILGKALHKKTQTSRLCEKKNKYTLFKIQLETMTSQAICAEKPLSFKSGILYDQI